MSASSDEILKRWAAAEIGHPDEWENVTVEWQGPVWYSTDTGGEDGYHYIALNGREMKTIPAWNFMQMMASLIEFGRKFDEESA